MLGLFFAQLKGRLAEDAVSEEIRQLVELPQHMRTVLDKHQQIGVSAKRHALAKTYWATVGSGPNKSAADEIRIKLSELCYKTISSDFIEDKKHIDLSSEPLIIVCAAGASGTVIGDIIKDTAIFQAHKATPVVIADEGEARFEPYAADVFYVPVVAPHLAPVLNTLAGHIWGYYAALAINQGSIILDRFRQDINAAIDAQLQTGQDIYEVILERSFREEVAKFYNSFRKLQADGRFPVSMAPEAAADLPLLLKYLAGRLPVTDFEVDFGIKGTAANIIHVLNRILGQCINTLSRPVDAIKHQAKTVTVGTSRIREKFDGLLFDVLNRYGFKPSQLINRNVLVLRNLQGVIADIRGAILYKIGNLNLLGELTEDATITVIKKEGVLAAIPSRVETDQLLKGTKRIIVERGNVYIGKGRKDGRSIVVIPTTSTDASGPNIIEHLLLLNIAFRKDVSLGTKIRALGGKYDHIKNIVQENSIFWQEKYVDLVAIDDLFGRSAEKIGETIVSKVQQDRLSRTA
jgi:glucosamine--fructose-6-phosphate aminotransferase (isomerizing)